LPQLNHPVSEIIVDTPCRILPLLLVVSSLMRRLDFHWNLLNYPFLDKLRRLLLPRMTQSLWAEMELKRKLQKESR
jgi:hypothetical protein